MEHDCQDDTGNNRQPPQDEESTNFLRRILPPPSVRTLLWLAVFILPWLAAFSFGPKFEINDDVGNVILFRELFGTGSADTSIFVSSIFTHILIYLNRVNASIPWYSLLVFFTLGAAQLLLLHLLAKIRLDTIFRLSLVAVVTAVVFRLVLFCSFTASALLLSSAALIYGLIFSESGARRKVTAMLLLAVGFLLRPGIFPIALLTFLPVLLAALLSQALPWRKILSYCLLIFAIISGLYLADLAVESPTKKNFKVVNSERAKFSDSSWGGIDQDFNKALFAAGWSLNDYFVVKGLWWYLDKDVHSPDSISKFTAVTQDGHSIPWSREALTSNLLSVKYGGGLFLLLLAAWLGMETGFRARWAWGTLTFSLLCLLLLAGIRFPPRVAYPVLLLLIFAPLAGVSPQDQKRNEGSPFLQWGGLAGILLLIFLMVGDNVQSLKELDSAGVRLQRAVTEGLDELAGQNPATIFLPLFFDGFSEASFVNPFPWQEIHKTLPFGWMAQSPVRDPYLQSLGFDLNRAFVPQLLNRKDVIFYCAATEANIHAQVLDPLLGYLNEHYGEGAGAPRLIPRIRKAKRVGSIYWWFIQIEKEAVSGH